jgi:hypothetical protein
MLEVSFKIIYIYIYMCVCVCVCVCVCEQEPLKNVVCVCVCVEIVGTRRESTSFCWAVWARCISINSSTQKRFLVLKVEIATVWGFEVMLTKKRGGYEMNHYHVRVFPHSKCVLITQTYVHCVQAAYFVVWMSCAHKISVRSSGNT